jgi:hypothetical protein
MADRPVSPGWRWPGDGQCGGHVNGVRCTKGPEHAGPCGPAFKAEVHVTESRCNSDYTEADLAAAMRTVQLRKDRDELAAALEIEHARSFEYVEGEGTVCWGMPACSTCALIARIKGG